MERKKLSKIILLIALFICLSQLTYGWNKPTHMVIGGIVYKDLKATSAQTVARIIAILKQHPYYNKQWRDEISKLNLSAEEQDMYLFMVAARWPDDVRSGEGNYHHSTWHYVNYVYKPSEKSGGDSYPTAGENIVTAFKENMAVLQSNEEDSKKAIALCWVFHLVGDIHQPLHTSTYISDLFPEGDRGGNLYKIKVKEESKTINLHSFWDGLIIGSNNFQSINNTVVELRQRINKNMLAGLKQKEFFEWSKESFVLAKTVAYQNGKLSGSTDDQNGALLPEGYTTTAKTVAEKQVMLSAYRLADLLGSAISL